MRRPLTTPDPHLTTQASKTQATPEEEAERGTASATSGEGEHEAQAAERQGHERETRGASRRHTEREHHERAHSEQTHQVSTRARRKAEHAAEAALRRDGEPPAEEQVRELADRLALSLDEGRWADARAALEDARTRRRLHDVLRRGAGSTPHLGAGIVAQSGERRGDPTYRALVGRNAAALALSVVSQPQALAAWCAAAGSELEAILLRAGSPILVAAAAYPSALEVLLEGLSVEARCALVTKEISRLFRGLVMGPHSEEGVPLMARLLGEVLDQTPQRCRELYEGEPNLLGPLSRQYPLLNEIGRELRVRLGIEARARSRVAASNKAT